MPISYSITDTINYEEVGLGVEDPTLVFPAIYGNFDFGYTVTFSSDEGEITNTSIISSPLYTDETELSANAIRIEKNSNQVFPNETYDFAFFDESFSKTVETYNPGSTDLAGADASVFAWNTPTQESVNGQYVFEITFINTVTLLEETTTETFSQTLQWSQFPGTVILQDLVQESKY